MARRLRGGIPVVAEEEEKDAKEDFKKKINDLPENDPAKCEGLIRALYTKISNLKNADIKEQLLHELKTCAWRGLGEQLRTEVEKNGLGMEALDLILKFLTSKPELAQYLFIKSQTDVEKDGLEVVKRRLGPNLEVLGGLASKGIDLTKTWVARLVETAPSLQSLARISVSDLNKCCKEEEEVGSGASNGEMEVVRELIKTAENRSKDPKKGSKEDKPRAIDEEKLEKARALMNEAKEMAAKESETAKKAVKEKMAEITKILQLPPDWYKQDIGTKPDQLFKELDNIIQQFEDVVEVGEPYKSDLEVVASASGGRALCGIYYSKYTAAITAERPLIEAPAIVKLTSPNNSQQIRYVKFSESRAAANYVQTVKASSSNIGFSVGGFASLFIGEVHGRYGSSSQEDRVTSAKSNTNNASVLQYIWIATKTFKIDQEEIRLSLSARKMAMSIVKPGLTKTDSQKAARCFLKRYGSHYPAGLHTLGGVLFRTVDAHSKSLQDVAKLTEKAAQQLQGQISAGFLGSGFGIGMSVSGEHSSSSGKQSAHQEEEDETSYTYAFQSMGPAATNPSTFSKLLANNSTWALIDRGSPNAYIPVWELLRDLGKDFEEAAKVLKDTWKKDEKESRRKTLNLERRFTEIIKTDLENKRDELIRMLGKVDYGHYPKNGAELTFTFPTINLPEEEAFNTAVDIIMEDPRYRICEIALCAGEVYTVRCWQATEIAEMTFQSVDGGHVLFYSEMLFKWKNKIPPLKLNC